jgi:NAD(P)H-nitrite reductase large subunit
MNSSTNPEETLCYCFNFSKEDVKQAVIKRKDQEFIEDLKKKMKDPGCDCEKLNPSGKCCLADIETYVRFLKSQF